VGYTWRQDYEEGQTRAVCSKCGVPGRFPAEIVKLDDGYFYCLRACYEKTVLSRDKLLAQSRRRREMPPPKFVIPPRYNESYYEPEAQVFSSVASAVLTSTSPNDLGWMGNYLADMVQQGKRPTRWTDRATTLLKSCCDSLLTLQYGAPTGPAPSITVEKARYGGFGDGTTLYTASTAIAGVALAKGYQVLGTQTYLDAASRCAHFLRHMQCQDLDSGGNAIQWNGGPYHTGGFSVGVTASSTIAWTTQQNLFDTIGAWFLTLLGSIQGTTTSYGAASSSDFSGSTVATLATMITEAVSFAVLGAYDVFQNSARVTGLSTTYPRAYYSPQSAGAAGMGTWGLWAAPAGTLPLSVLYGRDFAAALFSLNYIGGSSATVNAVYDWLMTFTANSANAPPAEDPLRLIGNTQGVYNPKIAIADMLDLTDTNGNPAKVEHVGAAYDWAATALLAPIASVRTPADFATSKGSISTPQPTSAGWDPQLKYIGPYGKSGLSFQIVAS
jgi:hypothetical protein